MVLRWSMLVFTIHLAFAVYCKYHLHIDIQNDAMRNWDWFWQHLPGYLLISQPLVSLQYLHSQPPLWNALNAILLKLFGGSHLQALQWVNIFAGATMSAMMVEIGTVFFRSGKLAVAVAIFLSLNPALVLFEAYPLYTCFSAFLVVCVIYFFVKFTRHANWVYGGFSLGAALLLTLTRSLYHAILLVPIAGLIIAGARPPDRRKLVVIGFVTLTLPIAWYIKNLVQFGFFGPSSWIGMGLYKAASYGYNSDELRNLASSGVIQKMVVEVPVFSRPSAYRRYGFNRYSKVDALNQDDYNNVNIPSISKVYMHAAIKLIRLHPIRYIKTVCRAYRHFTKPSSRFKHLLHNSERLGWYERFWADWLQGCGIARVLLGSDRIGPFLFVLLPLSLLGYASSLVTKIRSFGWTSIVQSDAPMLLTAMLIFYTMLVGCMMEYGEQDRFKFLVEQPMWAFIVAFILRIFHHSQG